MPNKTPENRARRALERRGLQLQKSRRRDPKAATYGGFQIYDPTSQTVITGGMPPFSMSLTDVEAWLAK